METKNSQKSSIKWPKLPVRFKSKWVKALRSGKYNQGKQNMCLFGEGWMKGESKYCCLGVAGKVLGLEDRDMDAPFISDLPDNKKFPKAFFDPVDPKLFKKGNRGWDKDLQHYLAQLNDDEGFSFKDIADFIEKEL